MAKDPSELLAQYGLDENVSAEENLRNFDDPDDLEDENTESYPVDQFDPDEFIKNTPVEAEFDPDAFIAANPLPEEESKESSLIDTRPYEVRQAEHDKSIGELGRASLAGLMGLGRSASLGLADKLGAKMESMTPSPSADVDKALIEQGFKISQPANTYEANLQRRKNLAAEQAAQYPISSTIGDIAGYAVPGVGAEKIVAKGLAKIAPGISRLATVAPKVAEKAKMGGKALMARMAQSGLAGGLFGAGSNIIEGKPEDAVEMGAIGTVIGASIPPVGALLRSVPKALKKVSTFFGGPSAEAQKKYLIDPEFLSTVKSKEELKRGIDEVMSKIKGDFEAGKLAQEEAEKAVKSARELAKETLKQNEAAAKLDAGSIFDDAKTALDDAFQLEKERLSKTPPPVHVVDTVHESIESLQKKLIAESKKATELLEATPTQIEKSDLQVYLENEILELTKRFGKTSAGAAKELQMWYDDIVDKLPQQISGKQAKTLIQDIDQETKWKLIPGEFDEVRDRILKGLRFAINAPLRKANPAYAKAMDEAVSPLASLLDEATDAFGTVKKAQSKLFKIDNPLLQNEQRILQDLGLQTNQNFVKDLTEYLVTRKTVQSAEAMKQIKKALPQHEQFTKAQAAQEALARPHGEATPLGKQYLTEAEAAKKATSEAERLKAIFDKYKKLSEASSEGKIKNILQDRDMFSKDLIKDLSKETGKDFLGEIEKLNLASEIEPKLLETGLGTIPHMSRSSLKTVTAKQLLAPATKALIDVERATAKSPTAQKTLKALPTLHRQLGYALTAPPKDRSEAPIPQETKQAATPQLAEKKDRGHLDNITDNDIDQMKAAIPDTDSPQHNALRNILENARGRDVRGRAALLYSLKQNPAYRPFIEQYLKERGPSNER